MTDLWKLDFMQFPRLLAEIRAIGLTKEQRKELCDAMDITASDLDELFARAERAFASTGAFVLAGKWEAGPLPLAQMQGEECVSGLVPLELATILTDDTEHLTNCLSQGLTGTELLMEVSSNLIGVEGGTLWFHVEGNPEEAVSFLEGRQRRQKVKEDDHG